MCCDIVGCVGSMTMGWAMFAYVAECICIRVFPAKKIQLSEDAENALSSFDCFIMTFRGEMEIKV